MSAESPLPERRDFFLRGGSSRDVDDRLSIDDSFATDRVLYIEVGGESPEHDIRLRWRPTKPAGSRRGITYQRDELLAAVSAAERFWVAEVDGHARGFLILNRLDWHPTTGFLHDIAVDAPFRGRGIASTLLDAMKEHARRSGMRGVIWEAQTDNRDAIAFALHRGFSFAGFNDTWYANDGRLRQLDADFRGIAFFMYWPVEG